MERLIERGIAMAGCLFVAIFLLAMGIGCGTLDYVADAAAEGVMGAPDSGSASAPATFSPALDFRYGGFKGESAKEVAGCRIGSLRVSGSGLSYRWEKGGCEALGASGPTDYSQTVACAFYEDGGRWVGGKFDWISTSRTSRSFENIKSGYNGWDAAAFFGAKRHGFCIVSKDGKRRSNFIEE